MRIIVSVFNELSVYGIIHKLLRFVPAVLRGAFLQEG